MNCREKDALQNAVAASLHRCVAPTAARPASLDGVITERKIPVKRGESNREGRVAEVGGGYANQRTGPCPLAGEGGFEPPDVGSKDRCLTTRRLPREAGVTC